MWIAWVNTPELRFATAKAPRQRSIYHLLPLRGLSDLDFFDCLDRHRNWGGSAAQNAAAPEVISPRALHRWVGTRWGLILVGLKAVGAQPRVEPGVPDAPPDSRGLSGRRSPVRHPVRVRAPGAARPRPGVPPRALFPRPVGPPEVVPPARGPNRSLASGACATQALLALTTCQPRIWGRETGQNDSSPPSAT